MTLMTQHMVIHENVFTSDPAAEQRLDPRSRLAAEVLDIDLIPCCSTLDGSYIYRVPLVQPNLFERVQFLALTGERW